MSGFFLISLGLQLALLILIWIWTSTVLYSSDLQPVQKSSRYYSGAFQPRAMLRVVQRCQGILLGTILLVAIPEIVTAGQQFWAYVLHLWTMRRMPEQKRRSSRIRRLKKNNDYDFFPMKYPSSSQSSYANLKPATNYSKFWIVCFLILIALRVCFLHTALTSKRPHLIFPSIQISIIAICVWLLSLSLKPVTRASEGAQYSPTIPTSNVEALDKIIEQIQMSYRAAVGWIAVCAVETCVGFYTLGRASTAH
ncbi:hypothetical protein DFJ77DRAFT_446319 [Powellomyces hirtus]|nr:hypothetical protein DFJ77DRAFT_446319 [Powellomyces hirtus]